MTKSGKDDVTVDNEFIYDNGDEFYYVVFNYSTDENTEIARTPDYGHLGLNPDDYTTVKELWEGDCFSPSDLEIRVPPKDVRIYRFSR